MMMFNQQLAEIEKLIERLEAGRERLRIKATIERQVEVIDARRAEAIKAVRALEEAEHRRTTVEKDSARARHRMEALTARLAKLRAEDAPGVEEVDNLIQALNRQISSAKSMSGSALADRRGDYSRSTKVLREAVSTALSMRNRNVPADLEELIPELPGVELNRLAAEVSAAASAHAGWDAPTAHAALYSLYARFRILDAEYSLGQELRDRLGSVYGQLRSICRKSGVSIPERFNIGFEDWWALRAEAESQLHTIQEQLEAPEVEVELVAEPEAVVEQEQLAEEPAGV